MTLMRIQHNDPVDDRKKRLDIFLSKGDVGDSDSVEEVEEVLSGIEDAEVANEEADVVDGEVQQGQQQETAEPGTSRKKRQSLNHHHHYGLRLVM